MAGFDAACQLAGACLHLRAEQTGSARQWQGIAQIMRLLAQGAKDKALQQALCRSALHLPGMQSALLGEVDLEGTALRVAAVEGNWARKLEGRDLPLQQALQWVVNERRPLLLPSPRQEPAAALLLDHGIAAPALACFPIEDVDGQVAGILIVGAAGSAKFTPAARAHLDLLATAGRLLNLHSLAGSTLLLQAERFTRMTEIGRILVSERDRETALSMLMDLLLKLVPADAACLFVLDQATQIEEAYPCRGLIGGPADKARLAMTLMGGVYTEMPLVFQEHRLGAVSLVTRERLRPDEYTLLDGTAHLVAFALELHALVEHLHNQVLHTVDALAAAVELKDPFLNGHARRVARWAALVAARLKLPDNAVERIRLAGLLHDVGTLGLTETLPQRPGCYDAEEYPLMQEHVHHGAALVSRLPSLRDLAPAILHHHERWDGAGYPQGLAGEAIPLAARILQVVDTFDALVFPRPCQTAFSVQKALESLHQESGRSHDPSVLRAFFSLSPTHLVAQERRDQDHTRELNHDDRPPLR